MELLLLIMHCLTVALTTESTVAGKRPPARYCYFRNDMFERTVKLILRREMITAAEEEEEELFLNLRYCPVAAMGLKCYRLHRSYHLSLGI